jgi:D-lactate dehydrogenase
MFVGPRRRLVSLQRERRFVGLAGRSASTTVASQNSTKKAADAPGTATTNAAAAVSALGRSYGQQRQQLQRFVPIALLSLAVGFAAGRQSLKQPDDEEDRLTLPNGLPRTCCEEEEENEQQRQHHAKLFVTLKRIVGRKNVLDGRTESTENSQFLKGARLGRGTALYIVKPTKLKQLVELLQTCSDADCTVLVQGQNTGLTGGSVPRNNNHNDNDNDNSSRPTVIVSMKEMNSIFPIDDGKRVVCMGGVGLATLQKFVDEHFDRESHSILGSTFLNPTTGAGVAFGSGGTQCRKGPAFTERALYLKVVPDKFGKHVVKVVNTLGIRGLDQEEGEFDAHLDHNGVIRKLDAYWLAADTGLRTAMKKSNDTYGTAAASDVDYKNRLCRHDSQVSRYNADTSGCDCNRSEGKVMILASVHDTFPKPDRSKTYWMSFDSLDTALLFRRHVCLDNPQDVPVSVEYMDRDSFDVIDRSGRLLGNIIKLVGTSSTFVKEMWGIKLWIESLDVRGASTIVDKVLYWFNPITPAILPKSIMTMGTKWDHHIAITVGDYEGSLDRFLERMKDFQSKHGGDDDTKVNVHECTTASEQSSLNAFRFVAAPAFRTWCVGQGVQGFSVDYALPKNGGQAPPLGGGDDDAAMMPLKRMRYSHFGCNVVHEDLAFGPEVDIESVKKQLKKTIEHKHGGKLPAEHGHGTEYHAPEPTQRRWKNMDPLNIMNPGIGGLSTKYRYQE